MSERRIRDFEREQRQVRERYKALDCMLRAGLGSRPESAYWLMVVRRGQLLNQARLRWCRESRHALAQLQGQEKSP